MLRLIVCALGAMIGAGFASGREILRFFSRFGALSWPLIALTAGMMGKWMAKILSGDGGKDERPWRKALLLPLYLGTAGAMTAAAGELTALTIPLHHARSLGMICTLAFCSFFCRRCVRAMYCLGRVMIVLLMICWLICAFSPVNSAAEYEVNRFAAFPLALCYGAMNVMLAAGVLRDAGSACTARQRKGAAIWTGIFLACLLTGINAVLLGRRGELHRQAIPLVYLMRSMGKRGYDLAALVMYLAVATTLIAVLRNIEEILRPFFGKHTQAFSALAAAGVALLGFEDIIDRCYPLLGGLCLILLCMKKAKAENTFAE